MYASGNGYLDVALTLLEVGALVNAKDNVRNQLMIMMMMIIV